MSRKTPIDRATGELKDYLTRRIFHRLARDLSAFHGYAQVRYADLAHLVGLPWIWTQDNAATIVILRAALAKLARARLISARGSTHTEVLVKIVKREGEE